MFRLHASLLLCLVLLVGCVQPNRPVAPVPDPSPQPIVLTVEQAAKRFTAEYRTGLARAAGEVARRAEAGEFADVTAVEAAWFDASKAAREQANGPLMRAMDAAFIDSAGRPGRDLAPLLRDLERGFSAP